MGFPINSWLVVPGRYSNIDSARSKILCQEQAMNVWLFLDLHIFYLIFRMLRVFCPTLYLEMYVSRPGCLLVIKTITEISLSARSAICLRENLMFWVRGQKRTGLIISSFLLFSFTWLKFTYCSLENICKKL